MKKIKIISLLIIVLLLTGCSGTYNLKINEDLSVEENINLTVPSDGETYEKTTNLFESNNINKNNYDVVASDNNVKITYNEKYDSIEDYILNSKLYKNLFETINYENDKKTIKLSTNSVFKLDDSESLNIINDYNISLLQINLDTPFKVVENNSDNISDNIYSWILNKKTTSKDIIIELDIRNKSNTYIPIIVLSLISILTIGSIIIIVQRVIRRQKM